MVSEDSQKGLRLSEAGRNWRGPSQWSWGLMGNDIWITEQHNWNSLFSRKQRRLTDAEVHELWHLKTKKCFKNSDLSLIVFECFYSCSTFTSSSLSSSTPSEWKTKNPHPNSSSKQKPIQPIPVKTASTFRLTCAPWLLTDLIDLEWLYWCLFRAVIFKLEFTALVQGATEVRFPLSRVGFIHTFLVFTSFQGPGLQNTNIK